MMGSCVCPEDQRTECKGTLATSLVRPSKVRPEGLGAWGGGEEVLQSELTTLTTENQHSKEALENLYINNPQCVSRTY